VDESEFLKPLIRLKDAIDSLDPRATNILAAHAAIEHELDLAIAHELPKADRLISLGFGQKIRVWAATQEYDDKLLDVVVTALVRLNDLRNAVAHGDSPKKVDAALKRLVDCLPDDAPHRDRADVLYVAAFISGVLSGPSRRRPKIMR
jgi:hypothetical protein